MLWRIGHLASSGIRKMSEYGSHAELEQEIALNGERIKRLVKKQKWLWCTFVNKHGYFYNIATLILRYSRTVSLDETSFAYCKMDACICSTVHSKRIASCCGSRRASFHVDKYKHLFSAMSRISPSPDWNVGVDSLDLCDHATCSWKKKIELDLEPWDAGKSM